VLSLLETINKIKTEKISAIRYGDGEMSLIYNENLGFQKNNTELSQRLRTILQTNNTKLLICIPGIWGNINNFSKRSFWFTLHHLFKFGHRWEALLNKNQTYGDAFITRPYLNYKDEKSASAIFSAMQSIWSGESITLIEGAKSRLGVGNDLFNNATSVKRILCPSENAYEKYEQIKEESLKIDKNELVLLSLGPTAKVLAYDLFLAGYRVIDIGHIDMEYEMFLRGSKELVEVPYKYFNEIEARNPEDCKDPVYLSQIIARIE
jgi:glycosyltransferase family protein